MNSYEYFNQLRDKNSFQAFEVENIYTRENYTFVYNPFNHTVVTYNTSINQIIHNPILITENGFKLEIEPYTQYDNIYDYFVYLYNKSIGSEEGKEFFFIGWVDPLFHNPYEDNDKNYFTIDFSHKQNLIQYLEIAKYVFLEKIPDNHIKELFDEYGYFAGGCISSLMLKEEVNDYDIFFKNSEALESVKEYFKNNTNIKTFITDNAITIDEYQIILIDKGDIKDVLNRFDFAHSMVAYDFKSKEIYIDYYIRDKITNKTLKYNMSSETPFTSIHRFHKFISRGYACSRRETMKIMMALHDEIYRIKDKEKSENIIKSTVGKSYYEEMIDKNKKGDGI